MELVSEWFRMPGLFHQNDREWVQKYVCLNMLHCNTIPPIWHLVKLGKNILFLPQDFGLTRESNHLSLQGTF